MPRGTFRESDYMGPPKPSRLQSATTAVTDAAVALPAAVACGVAGSVVGAVEAFGQHWSDANKNKQADPVNHNHCDKQAADKFKKVFDNPRAFQLGGTPTELAKKYKTPSVAPRAEEKSGAKAVTDTAVALGGATVSAVGGAFKGGVSVFLGYMSEDKKKRQAARAGDPKN